MTSLHAVQYYRYVGIINTSHKSGCRARLPVLCIILRTTLISNHTLSCIVIPWYLLRLQAKGLGGGRALRGRAPAVDLQHVQAHLLEHGRAEARLVGSVRV